MLVNGRSVVYGNERAHGGNKIYAQVQDVVSELNRMRACCTCLSSPDSSDPSGPPHSGFWPHFWSSRRMRFDTLCFSKLNLKSSDHTMEIQSILIASFGKDNIYIMYMQYNENLPTW